MFLTIRKLSYFEIDFLSPKHLLGKGLNSGNLSGYVFGFDVNLVDLGSFFALIYQKNKKNAVFNEPFNNSDIFNFKNLICF